MSEEARSHGGEPTIVVGVDGSEASVEALGWAIEEATRRGAAVEMVTVWEDPYTVIGPAPHPSIHRPTMIRLHQVQEIAEGRARARLGGARHETVVRRKQRGGDPISVLCEMARHADLLVVGARGVGALEGTLLGSVSRGCIQRSTVPVVVVPPAAVRTRGERQGGSVPPMGSAVQHR